MKLAEIMTPDVEVVGPNASLVEAAAKMRALNVGVLPVTEGKQLVGIITDRDITVRAVADGRDPNHMRVRDCMSPEAVSCFEDQDSGEAVRLMEERQIRRVPVLDQNRQLVGVVSLADIATKLGTEQAARTTAAVSAPTPDAGTAGSDVPIARNANPAGVSTARQVPTIPERAQGQTAGAGSATEAEMPIARNANPAGVD